MLKGQEKFPHLFSKGKIGKFEVKNRVKYAACCVSNFNNLDGSLTDREFARDEVIASTGCGLITNQGAYPDKSGLGKAYTTQLCINDDRFIPDLAKVADAYHKDGAIALQQLLHGGRCGGIDAGYCLQPSDTPQTLRHFKPPRAMTKDEIQESIQEHADAAARSIKAGYEGVEVTSFLGYLLACFLSAFVNKRTDEYGGSVEKRGRFMVEMIQAIRKAIGDDKLLIIRLNGAELMDEYGGSTEEECLEFMKMADDAGVDMISMVIGWHESRQGALGWDVKTDGWLYLAENAKKHIKAPLAFGPRFADPTLAEKALAEGTIDFWEVCRPFLSDPLLLKKTEEDRLEDIKPCINGMTCLARMFSNQPYVCTVNPVLGHELEPEYHITPAVRKKKVMVIGAGPAGIESAIAASGRDHDVTIYDKKDRLGGQLIYASKNFKNANDLSRLIKYYETTVNKMNIKIKLGVDVDRKVCGVEKPDVVVVATGADIVNPNIPGIDKENVIFAWDALEGNESIGDKVVIIGGGKVGLTTAELLASHGKKIWIIEPQKRVDYDITMTFK